MARAQQEIAEKIASRRWQPLGVSVPVAAGLLDIGETVFRAEVLPELRTVQVGSLTRVPVAEIVAWLDRHAAGNFVGETHAKAGWSGSVLTEDAGKSPPASEGDERKRRLKRLVATSTPERSGASNVVDLRGAKSRSRKRGRNG